MKIILRWLLLAAALLLVAYLYPGVSVTSFTAALIAAFVLGLFNTLLRPLLVLLTLPVTLITLGLFLFVKSQCQPEHRIGSHRRRFHGAVLKQLAVKRNSFVEVA